VVNQREQFGSKSDHLQACVFVCESFGGNFFHVNDSSSRFLKKIKKKDYRYHNIRAVNQRKQFGSKSDHLHACVFALESFGGSFFRVKFDFLEKW
jgi:hypothetical protein